MAEARDREGKPQAPSLASDSAEAGTEPLGPTFSGLS